MSNALVQEFAQQAPATDIRPVREVLANKPIRPRFVSDEFFGAPARRRRGCPTRRRCSRISPGA